MPEPTTEVEWSPAGLRKAFPAHRALEQVHTYARDGVTHLRIAGAEHMDYGYGGDQSLCAHRLEGATCDLTHRGRRAIMAANCPSCREHGDNMLHDAETEREGVQRERAGMKSTLSVLDAMERARTGGEAHA